MKWEILKGSEKDFDGAPDSAVYVLNFGGLIYADSSMVSIESSPYEIDEDRLRRYLIAERRPITEPVVNQQLTTEWDGEGLPPVGVECEIKRAFDWLPVIIKYISGYYTVTQTLGGTEQAYQTSALQFRPVRSAEDVAREDVLNAMSDASIEFDSNNPIIERIYDAIAAGKIPGVKLE